MQYRNMINTTSCTAINLLLIVLLNKTRFTAFKTGFLVFLIDFWTQNPVYFEATNSGILIQHSNILGTISCTVVNLLLIVLLKKRRCTASKTRFFAFLVDFWTRNPVYFEATNSGMLLQGCNILEATFCTVINLLLTVLRNKTPFAASEILIIRNLKTLHNPGDGQVPLIGAIFLWRFET